MGKYQQLKQSLLRPLLGKLTRVGIGPDHVTLAGLAAGLAFCPLYFWSKPLAFSVLAGHLLIDGIDGSLARHQNIASSRGSFTDTVADQIVVTASTITLMLPAEPLVSLLPGCIYIFLYTMVVAFAMVRNALGIPYTLLWRPRLIVFVWVALDQFVFPGTMWHHSTDAVLCFFNALLAMMMWNGFLKIRARL